MSMWEITDKDTGELLAHLEADSEDQALDEAADETGSDRSVLQAERL